MSNEHVDGRANAPLPVQGATPFAVSQERYHIVRATLPCPARGICINPTIQGVDVHYVEGRTHPCTAHKGRCPWCADGSRLRWYGYMPCLLPEKGRVGLIELTHRAVTDAGCLAGVKSLRGQGIKVERLGQGKRARCSLSFENYRPSGKLPEPIDTSAALDVIWGEFAMPRTFDYLEEVPLQ
jgi:hypothetical protein